MNSPSCPACSGPLAPALDHYGYLAVAGFVFLEDFGIPVPGETILIAGAVCAGACLLDVPTWWRPVGDRERLGFVAGSIRRYHRNLRVSSSV